MAPHTKPKMYRHKKMRGRQTGKLRGKSWRLSLVVRELLPSLDYASLTREEETTAEEGRHRFTRSTGRGKLLTHSG